MVMKAAVFVPGDFPSVANRREHWAARHRRAKRHRADAAAYVRCAIGAESEGVKLALPLTVVLTRWGIRTLDTDNLASALKALRDGVADALGVDDGDLGVQWLYQQARGTGGVHVLITDAAEEEG